LQIVEREDEEQYVTRIPVSKDGSQAELNKVFAGLSVDLHSTDQDAAYVHTSTKEERVDASPLTVREGRVPNVKGMGLADALHVLENQGLFVEVKGRGTVKGQSILPGTPTSAGMHIKLDLSL